MIAALLIATVSHASAQTTLITARQLFLTGRYEEAMEQYESLEGPSFSEIQIGRARCEEALGKDNDPIIRLQITRGTNDDDPKLHAELAALYFKRGMYVKSHGACEQAIELDKNQPLARWISAELHRVRGELTDAEKGYDWLVEYYNKTEKIDDPETLHVIALAAAQRARWKRDSEQFRFLVNRLYPRLLRLEKNYWPAHLEAGRLFLEKYNQREATRQFNAALAINPNSAEVHAARAELAMLSYDLDRSATGIERALEINPNLLHAHQLKSDWLMSNFRVRDAIGILESARALNPRSEQTLGRLAAAYVFADGADSRDEEDSRLSKLIAEAEEFNPRCGGFYEAMGDGLDLLRKYPAAADAYASARQRMPQLIGIPGKLGLVQMRLGDEAAAKKLLDESFEADPFNVRVKNSLEVLDVLETYAVIETEHFVIKFDRGQDQMLAEYAAEYLENEVYPQIVKDFTYEPAEKSLFEIFSRAKNTSGHGWFSARMVGLPYIGTVGACAGQMVAIASPNDMPEPYNWARVLQHEFVHVVNLQQTNFNIPHWFTEALAVRSEGYPRPPEWTRLLAKRQAEDSLFTLHNINHGFLRPGDGDDWTLAYAQSEIYAEFMVEQFGEQSLAKMLAAYRDNMSTPEAIEHCFGVSQEQFEAGYREYLERLLAGAAGAQPRAAMSLAELEMAAEETPDDAEILAKIAHELLKRKSNADARRQALAAIAIDEKQQLAAYVMARLYLLIGDTRAAAAYLHNSFQEDSPQTNHLALLAGILMRAKKYDEAEILYQLGAEKFPHDDAWLKRLASVHLQAGSDEKLAGALSQLAQLDTASVAYRTKLAQLAFARDDYEQAEHWAMQALQINIKDAKLHALRAEALAALNRPADAAREYGYALRLDPGRLPWRFAQSKALVDAGKNDEAKVLLKKLLKQSPKYPGASELLEKLR